MQILKIPCAKAERGPPSHFFNLLRRFLLKNSAFLLRFFLAIKVLCCTYRQDFKIIMMMMMMM